MGKKLTSLVLGASLALGSANGLAQTQYRAQRNYEQKKEKIELDYKGRPMPEAAVHVRPPDYKEPAPRKKYPEGSYANIFGKEEREEGSSIVDFINAIEYLYDSFRIQDFIDNFKEGMNNLREKRKEK